MHIGSVTHPRLSERGPDVFTVSLRYVVGLTTAVGIFRLRSPLERWRLARCSYLQIETIAGTRPTVFARCRRPPFPLLGAVVLARAFDRSCVCHPQVEHARAVPGRWQGCCGDAATSAAVPDSNRLRSAEATFAAVG
jgi:hypothetical protein